MDSWRKLAVVDRERRKSFFHSIKSISATKVDAVASKANAEVFDKIDCLQCGNCCKSAPPVLVSSDIRRISKHLGISKKEFQRQYVLEDINGELSMNRVPCPFLGPDNACAIYEIRPDSCARYPFADVAGFARRTYVHESNVMICPAMFHIVNEMQSKLNTNLSNANK